LAKYRTFIGDMLNKYYFQPELYVNLPTLVNGDDLIDELKLAPSKKLGDLLKKISEAQVRGELKSREEALAYARILLSQNND
ncbi:MAG: hypothetical protein K6U74_08005, partial [Firmicutes bacterium]|nr:hypothetical protein [Bacillota bacterium]